MGFLRGTLVSTHTHTDIRCLDVYQQAIVHRSELASSSWKHEHRVYVCENGGERKMISCVVVWRKKGGGGEGLALALLLYLASML